MKVHHANCLEILPEQATECQVMIVDPPYSRHVHKSAVSHSKGGGYRQRDFGFSHLTPPARRWLGKIAAALPRWSVMYSDVEHSNYLRIAAQAAGARYIRTIPWVRWSMPQMTGTMPPQGFEHILCFHAKSKGMHWNGPGDLLSLGPLTDKCMRGKDKHRAQKPLSQALTLVSYFSDPGDKVFDPMAGSGTVALACRLLGRSFISCEANEEWAALATERVNSDLCARDRDSAAAWLAQPESNAFTEKAAHRAEMRRADRERVAKELG